MTGRTAALIAAVVALVGLERQAGATSTVVINGGSEFVLAADAKKIWSDGSEGSTKCKIIQGARCVFMLSGKEGVCQRGRDCSMFEPLALQACAAGGGVDAIMDRFLAAARGLFAAGWGTTPPEFRRLYLSLVARRGDRLVARYGGWEMEGNVAKAFPPRDIMGLSARDPERRVEILKREGYRLGPPLGPIARRIVELDMEETPDTVGPPIQVLSIDGTTGRARWIQQGPCPPLDPALLP